LYIEKTTKNNVSQKRKGNFPPALLKKNTDENEKNERLIEKKNLFVSFAHIF
jgi:hypothetical protein